jgi:hypothetical protein
MKSIYYDFHDILGSYADFQSTHYVRIFAYKQNLKVRIQNQKYYRLL